MARPVPLVHPVLPERLEVRGRLDHLDRPVLRVILVHLAVLVRLANEDSPVLPATQDRADHQVRQVLWDPAALRVVPADKDLMAHPARQAF